MLPEVSANAMNEFLAQFAATLPANEHAVMVLDRAGWHTARKLVVPSNVTLVWLPPYSPQLNPVERVWLFLYRPALLLTCCPIPARRRWVRREQVSENADRYYVRSI